MTTKAQEAAAARRRAILQIYAERAGRIDDTDELRELLAERGFDACKGKDPHRSLIKDANATVRRWQRDITNDEGVPEIRHETVRREVELPNGQIVTRIEKSWVWSGWEEWACQQFDRLGYDDVVRSLSVQFTRSSMLADAHSATRDEIARKRRRFRLGVRTGQPSLPGLSDDEMEEAGARALAAWRQRHPGGPDTPPPPWTPPHSPIDDAPHRAVG